jgi:hypothetical protein
VHGRRRLLDHLVGTRALLLAWGARPALADAGLFHSAYGTEAYAAASLPPSRRAEVRTLVGPEAEELAWLFGVLRRETLAANLGRPAGFWVEERGSGARVPLGAGRLADLAKLTVANGLEPLAGTLPAALSRAALRWVGAHLLPYRPLVLPAGQQALDALLAAAAARPRRWWQFWA